MRFWDTTNTSIRAAMTRTVRPPDLSMAAEAVKPTEQKKTLMKTSLRVSSNVNSSTSAECRRRVQKEKSSPPTTAAGMQYLLRAAERFSR